MGSPQSSSGTFGPREYSYEELAKAAQNFSNRCLLGEGGFGQVYKGSLHGETFAIKKLRHLPDQQTKRELEHEISVASRINHRNLVNLVGYCVDEGNALLVLEYFPNKSLRVNLHEKKNLDWPKRMKIAIGSARGLEYLHEHCNSKIVHQDIKSDNILLDRNFEAKIADFGLSLVFPDYLTHISKSIVGTTVYMDPDVVEKVSDKSDVYSFGVVLLELITARQPIYQNIDIVSWASTLIEGALKGNYEGFVDFQLQSYDEEEMERMTYCVAASVYNFPEIRPSMRKIVQALEGDIPLANIWNEKNHNKFRSFTPNRDNNDVGHHQTGMQEFHMVPETNNNGTVRSAGSSSATASEINHYDQLLADPYYQQLYNLDNQQLPNLYFQGSPNAGGECLEFFRSSQDLLKIRAMVQANQTVLQPMLQDLGSQNPHVVRVIDDDDFVRFSNEHGDSTCHIL